MEDMVTRYFVESDTGRFPMVVQAGLNQVRVISVNRRGSETVHEFKDAQPEVSKFFLGQYTEIDEPAYKRLRAALVERDFDA